MLRLFNGLEFSMVLFNKVNCWHKISIKNKLVKIILKLFFKAKSKDVNRNI